LDKAKVDFSDGIRTTSSFCANFASMNLNKEPQDPGSRSGWARLGGQSARRFEAQKLEKSRRFYGRPNAADKRGWQRQKKMWGRSQLTICWPIPGRANDDGQRGRPKETSKPAPCA
jgi:hypothetical protein